MQIHHTRFSATFIIPLLLLVAACGAKHAVATTQIQTEAPALADAGSVPAATPEVPATLRGAPMRKPAPALPDERLDTSDDRDATDTRDVKEDSSLLHDLKVDEKIEAEGLAQTSGGNYALIESEIRRLVAEFGEDEDEVPEVFISEVKFYIGVFQSVPQYRKFVTASLKRSARYMPMVKLVLGKRGIPEDMAYIAFIESGFNPHAVSHAGAVGMWQFMPSTARSYSLVVTRDYDERVNPVKATLAAVNYFHDLLAIFGPRSFLLAMAAYNAGEGKIISCLRGISNAFEERTFWHIRPCLQNETREFPPKIIAAAIIGNNPGAFGFPVFEHGEVDAATLSAEHARPVRAPYTPSAGDGQVKKSAKAGRQAEPSVKLITYTVKKGNTLPMVAEMFGAQTADIKRQNKLRQDRLSPGQTLRIVPAAGMEQVTYKVRKGDTITAISEAFGVRPAHLMTSNGMKTGLDLKAGQTLVLYRKTDRKAVTHTVRKGTTLPQIASAYNVKTKYILMWNNLESADLRKGQKLIIYAGHCREI